MNQRYVGKTLEQFCRKVSRAANPAGGVIQRGFAVFYISDEFLQIANRQIVPNRQYIGCRTEQTDWPEAFNDVVTQLAIDGSIDSMRTRIAHNHGIAVGFGAGNRLRSNHPSCARLVLYHNCLSERSADLVGQDRKSVV